MKGSTFLGVVTLAGLFTAARSQLYCHSVSVGDISGIPIEEDSVVPAYIEDYDVPVPLDCSTHIVGLTASACYKYDFSLIVLSETQVHVHRTQSPGDMIVKLEIYCYEYSNEEVPATLNVHNSPRHKLLVVKSSDSKTTEDVTDDNKTSEHENKTSEIVSVKQKRSVDVTEANEISKNVNDENKTSEIINVNQKKSVYVTEANKTFETKTSEIVSVIQKKSVNVTEENKTSEKDPGYQQDVVKKLKSIIKSKDGKIKKTIKISGHKYKVPQPSKKVKVVYNKDYDGERRRRSAEMVNLQLASSSSSEDITDRPKSINI